MGTSKKQGQHKIEKNKMWYLPLLPLLFIVIVWLVFSSPYFFKQRVPFPSDYLVSFFNPWTNYYGMPVKNGAMPDVITQIYPWKKITIDSLKSGVLPLWNPYQFSGNPHLANVQSAVFTPFNLLFFVLPFVDAWSLLVLLQPLCAAIFMYLFLRSLHLDRYGATLGSTSFMFCNFIVTWMAYGTLGYALLFLPLFLYGIERFLTKRDRLGIVVLIISSPLSVFSGHFQTSLYVLIVAYSYLVVRSLQEKKAKSLIEATLYICIGLIIASLQIVPTYKLYSQSTRSESYIQDEAIPWNQLIRIVAPDFFGNPVTRNDWVGQYAEWGIYAGMVPFLLGVFALFKRRNKSPVYFFGIVATVSILFSFEPQFISLLAQSRIPVLSTSTPSRIVGVISFCIAVLSAFGLNALIHEWRENKISRKLVVNAAISLIMLGAVWLYISSMEAEFTSIAKRNFILPMGLAVSTVILFFVGAVRLKYMHVFAPVFLILLTAFEMLRFSMKWMPFDSRKYVYPDTPILTYLQNNARENRVYGLIGNEVFSMFNLYGIEGYDPLYSRRYGEFLSTAGDGKIYQPARSTVVFPKSGKYAKKMLDILGVKYIVHSKGDGYGSWVFPFWDYPDSFTMVFSDERYEVHENKDAYPRAYLVNSYKIVTDNQQIIDEILSGETDIRKSVILEKNLDIGLTFDDCQVENPVEVATIETYQPTQIVIKTQSDCNSFIVLSDTYYPGWVSYVDGEKSEIYRANYTFRALPVSGGKHTVLLKYENWYL